MKKKRTLTAMERYRLTAGLTASQLAERAGVSLTTVRRYERNRHHWVHALSIQKIAVALHTALDEVRAQFNLPPTTAGELLTEMIVDLGGVA